MALLLCAPDAQAANKTPVSKLAAEAAKAAAAGDLITAIARYREVLQTDPRPEYVWALARVEQQDGQTDQALLHYRAFLAAPGSATDRVAEARAFVNEIERQRLDAQVQQVYLDAFQRGQVQDAQLRAVERVREMTGIQDAEAAARTGDSKQAAKLYLAAYQAGHDRYDELLFKAALAEQDARQWQAAAGHLEEYVKRASATAPAYSEAVTRLEALRRRLGTSAAGAPPPKAAPKPEAVADVPKDDDPAAIGWTLVKIGGAVALVGLGSYVWTHSQQADLEAQLRVGANGKIQDISRAEAADRVHIVNSHVVTALALGSVGVAAAGVGAFLILRAPAHVAVLPGPVPAGLAVAWQF